MFCKNRKNRCGRVVTIYGSVVKKEPIGYCHCSTHKGYLYASHYKKHKCKEKQCPFLEKNSEHPYWNQAERTRNISKLHKQVRKLYFDNQISLNEKLKLEKEIKQNNISFVEWYLKGIKTTV